MEKDVFGKKLTLDTAPVHIAPGGSVCIEIGDNTSYLLGLLLKVREEIAYGMIDIETNEAEDTFSTSIYLGKADLDTFSEIVSEGPLCWTEKDLPEGTKMTGLSMRSRNQVLDAIGDYVHSKGH